MGFKMPVTSQVFAVQANSVQAGAHDNAVTEFSLDSLLPFSVGVILSNIQRIYLWKLGKLNCQQFIYVIQSTFLPIMLLQCQVCTTGIAV